jgi:2-dehydro-3-deoxy-D-arabinonate dehydratase
MTNDEAGARNRWLSHSSFAIRHSPFAMSFPPTTVYRTPEGLVAQRGDEFFRLAEREWDALFVAADPAAWLAAQVERAASDLRPVALLAPIQSQEVWAAGVTYLRSRDARMDESKEAGGGSFYDRVYGAERPEIFFKATPHRVVPPGASMKLRGDARWNVPEPELTLAISSRGAIFGYTIGNDLSSRDIEGENPLYLPQAKFYDGACAIGPVITLAVSLPPPEQVTISLMIERRGKAVFEGSTRLTSMARRLEELVEWLGRETSFPDGVLLLTGTGIVPPDDFSLAVGDVVSIAIAGIGRLTNTIGQRAGVAGT